jgi:site-specific DNA-methyltransferase (adenine-specific)
MSERVLSRNSFGFTTAERGNSVPDEGDVKLISSGGIGYVPVHRVTKNKNLVDKYKISIGTLNPDRGGVNNSSDGKVNVTTKIKLLNPNEVVTETYIIIDYFDDNVEALNCANYISSKFVRYLVNITLSSMHIVKDNFQFVPIQDFSKEWTDELLYKKYNLSDEEVSLIEGTIRTMTLNLEDQSHE